MTAGIEIFRRANGDLVPLVCGTIGHLCREGDTVVFKTVTTEIPRMTLPGESLPPVDLRKSALGYEARFERLIDVWAGRTTFVLHDGADAVAVVLDIGPHEQKLDQASWEGLIAELAEISQALPWGMSPGQAGGELASDAPAVVHPAIIESQLPPFRRLMAQLLADPPVRTLRSRTLRPLDLSRRADLITMRWLGRRPLELAGLRGTVAEGAAPNSRVLVDQPQTVTSFDHSISRYVAWLLDRISGRLEATVEALGNPSGRRFKDPMADAYAKELAAQVSAAIDEIKALRRAPLFRAVTPAPLNDSALQALIDHPLYSALHRVGRRLADPGLAYAPGQDLYSSLKHSYDLFELLVLYRLAGAISRELPPKGWSEAKEVPIRHLPREDRPPDGGIWRWRGPANQILELRYQPWFRSAKIPPDDRRLTSLSALRIPDYVLILWHGAHVRSWVILDAKYRSGRTAIHEGLGDIHRYRDSLRVHGQPADAAYIIVPRLHPGAELYASPKFLWQHRLGALPIYGEGWMGPIWQSLADYRLPAGWSVDQAAKPR